MGKQEIKIEEIKSNVKEMLDSSIITILEDLDKVFITGCIDLESYEIGKYTLPKCILTALLEKAAANYSPKGCGSDFEKKVKKEVRNIRYFI